jgi:formate hydrogenlyase subunit 3/multisubunit Na+/H+ antiporter MnhD subunit
MDILSLLLCLLLYSGLIAFILFAITWLLTKGINKLFEIESKRLLPNIFLVIDILILIIFILYIAISYIFNLNNGAELFNSSVTFRESGGIFVLILLMIGSIILINCILQYIYVRTIKEPKARRR